MTTIAWDGKTLAADKQMTNHGLALRATKIKQIGDLFVAVSGAWDNAQGMFDWVREGMAREKYPSFQGDPDGFVGMLVVNASGDAVVFERFATPYPVEEPPFAMGSGRDFALGAMHAGATAEEAVRIAIALDASSGIGVDVLRVSETAAKVVAAGNVACDSTA